VRSWRSLTLTTSAIQRLKSVFRGELLAEGDPGYDDARKVFNAAIDRRPGLIARCTGPDDVAEAVCQDGLDT
jgi:hypothetical protein